MPMNATSSSTMMDRSGEADGAGLGLIAVVNGSRLQQLHWRIGDRHDDLQDHHGDTGGTPVTTERPDELDDDPSDEQQPEDEQRKPKDLKEQHQLEPRPDDDDDENSRQRTDPGCKAAIGMRRSRFRRSGDAPRGTRRRRRATAGTPWSPPCRGRKPRSAKANWPAREIRPSRLASALSIDTKSMITGGCRRGIARRWCGPRRSPWAGA